MTDVRVLVIAKAPVPGRSKTRLCPPCDAEQAAALAEAALSDTLAAVAASAARERTLVLEGEVGPWLIDGFEVIPQRGDGLAERLGAAFEDAGAPALLVGMDTPQLSATLLDQAAAALLRPGVDAVLGEAPDGGYWAVGLRRADPEVFRGVPMSTDGTAAAQRRRLRELGLRTAELPALRDVDTFADARAVAGEQLAGARFAAAVRALERRLAGDGAPAAATSARSARG